MGYIKDIKIGSGTANLIEPILYGTTNTAAGTQAKEVSISNFELVTGVTVAVKFTVTNTHATPQLNINSTGAKLIKYRGGNLPSAATLTANRVYQFVYDGTNWELIGDLDTNTQTITGVKGNAETTYRTGQVNLTPANIGAVGLTGNDTISGVKTFNNNIAFSAPSVAGEQKGFVFKGVTDSAGLYYLEPNLNDDGRMRFVISDNDSDSIEMAWSLYRSADKAIPGQHVVHTFNARGYTLSPIEEADGTKNTIEIKPSINNFGSIGNASYKWANIYATNFYGNLTGNASTASSIALSGVTEADDLKAIEALTDTSGFLKKTAANTWALDACDDVVKKRDFLLTESNEEVDLIKLKPGVYDHISSFNNFLPTNWGTLLHIGGKYKYGAFIAAESANILYYKTYFYESDDNWFWREENWQIIAHATKSTSNIGSATQPVYMTSTGVITAGTALKALAYKDSLVASDIPELSTNKLTSGTLPVGRGGTGQTSIANIQAGKDGNGNTISSTYLKLSGGTLTGVLHITPATGEGGELHLNAATSEITKNNIILDNYYGAFRIFGGASADGTTKTGVGTPLVIDPYDKTITGGYNFDGNSNTATQFASAQTISLTGDITGSASSTGGWSLATTIGAGKVTNTMLANSSMTVGNKTINLGETGSLLDILYNSTTIKTNSSWDIYDPGVYYVASSSTFQGINNPENENTYGGLTPYRYGQLIVSRAGNGGVAQFYISHRDSNSNTYGIHFRTGWNNAYVAAWSVLIDSDNYKQYTVTKTGDGASGNWNINAVNVTGTVDIEHGGTNATTAANATWNLLHISDPSDLNTAKRMGSFKISNSTTNTPESSMWGATWNIVDDNPNGNNGTSGSTWQLVFKAASTDMWLRTVTNGNDWTDYAKFLTDKHLHNGIDSTSTTLAATANSALIAAKKVASSNNTSKLYLIGATSQSTTGIDSYSYQYTYTNNGLLSALKVGLNLNGTEKAHLEWNNTDQSIDFIFN